MSLSYKTTEWNSKKVILGEGEFNLESPVNILIGFHGAESTPENSRHCSWQNHDDCVRHPSG